MVNGTDPIVKRYIYQDELNIELDAQGK